MRKAYSVVSAKIRVVVLIGFLTEVFTSFSSAFPPFRTEDAGTTPKGGFGVELENEFTDTDDGEGNLTKLTLIYGLVDWIEVDIDFPFLVLHPDFSQDESGFGDIILLSKLKILGEGGVLSEDKFLPDLVLEPSVSFPTGDEDKGLGLGETEFGFLLAVEKTFRNLTGRGNLGYFASDDPVFDENFRDRFFYGFQVDFPLFTEGLTLGSELTGGFGSGEGNPLFTLTGLVFQITDNISLNGAVEFGLKDAASSVTVILGITFGFNPFQRGFSE